MGGVFYCIFFFVGGGFFRSLGRCARRKAACNLIYALV